MDILHDDFLEDSFHEHLLALKTAVEREKKGAVEQIAEWAGVRRSTVYDWLERKCWPTRWTQIARLAIRSSQAGYSEFASFLHAATWRLSPLGEVTTDGTLTKEKRKSDVVWGELYQAEDANDGERIVNGGLELHAIADEVMAEGKRKQADRLRRVG